MNVLLSPQPSLFPRQHDARHSPSRQTYTPTMSCRKRKADDELESGRSDPNGGGYDGMSFSPLNTPGFSSRLASRPVKRSRGTEVTGRPLVLPRLLETLDAQSLRMVLHSICERHPEIGAEVVSTAPRPSVESALNVLEQYQDKLRDAFPFGGDAGSEYAYNRVKQALTALIDALIDFTPHYLPPHESQTTVSLSFLDGATKFIHNLPDWQSTAHKRHKDDAYEEISKAWALVVSEASKRGGGIQLQYGGWDQKLTKHNEQSGGRMQTAVDALGSQLGWMGNTNAGPSDSSSIRNQLLSGTYGNNLPVRVGPW